MNTNTESMWHIVAHALLHSCIVLKNTSDANRTFKITNLKTMGLPRGKKNKTLTSTSIPHVSNRHIYLPQCYKCSPTWPSTLLAPLSEQDLPDTTKDGAIEPDFFVKNTDKSAVILFLFTLKEWSTEASICSQVTLILIIFLDSFLWHGFVILQFLYPESRFIFRVVWILLKCLAEFWNNVLDRWNNLDDDHACYFRRVRHAKSFIVLIILDSDLKEYTKEHVVL